ncbi:hypothetical protein J4711_14405 [Staphylococcus epidermidis]|nr:hypothetical protein [Staphylococcus epidermidis]
MGDAAIAAGDVKVESGGSEIDGGLDKRWRRRGRAGPGLYLV